MCLCGESRGSGVSRVSRSVTGHLALSRPPWALARPVTLLYLELSMLCNVHLSSQEAIISAAQSSACNRNEMQEDEWLALTHTAHRRPRNQTSVFVSDDKQLLNKNHILTLTPLQCDKLRGSDGL